ncbi:MAG: ribosome small subunit-dependent GTPase A [Bacteroidetes bacterium]|nr:ribosome small subunit-dependent GTPase A [Bacteroidota bacterium]
MEKGTVIKSTGKHFIVLGDSGTRVLCSIKGRFRVREIKTTNPVAVGDRVCFQSYGDGTEGIISRLEPRDNYIIRKSSNLSHEAQIIAANIDQAVVMASVINPETPVEFIDRFLVTAQAYSVPAVVLFNKLDLCRQEDTMKLGYYMNLYKTIGYHTLAISLTTGENTGLLPELFSGKISLLAGNSGVGKSTMLNLLNPELNLRTREISSYHRQGKHTTTFPEMHPMPFEGAIIDTPGIRGFGVIDLEKGETYHFFPEIFRVAAACRFNNCLHISEPGCAVISAVESGEIAWTRYRSYISIMDDGDSRYR